MARRLAPLATAGLSLMLACAHSDPLADGRPASLGPWNQGPLVRLTLDFLEDVTPAWLPDGSGIAYSYSLTIDSVPRRCLAILPPGGGTRTRELCPPRDPEYDSLRVLREPAPGPGELVAWIEEVTKVDRIGTDRSAIRVGRAFRGDTGVAVHPLPYLAANGKLHSTATHIGWLDPAHLVYVGTDRNYIGTRGAIDTVMTGRDVVVLDLSTSPATLTLVPGTDEASSVWPAEDGKAIYYTINGDSRVFHRDLATGAVTVIHDFGALGIARDVTVRGSLLVAVVGGLVSYRLDPDLGLTQRDFGGPLRAVTLPGGEDVPVFTDRFLSRTPALSPDGRHIAAAAFDTLFGSARFPDLWLMEVP